MEYYLVMLRGCQHCKRQIEGYTDKAMHLARKAYHTRCPQDTLKIACEIVETNAHRDKYSLWLGIVETALKSMPKHDRDLLLDHYVKGVKVEDFGQKMKTSLSTTYRKLQRCSRSLQIALNRIDCTENWFRATFRNDEWVRYMLSRPNSGRQTQ